MLGRDRVPACRTAERIPPLDDEFLLDWCRFYLAGEFDLSVSLIPDIARRLVTFLEAEAQQKGRGHPPGRRAEAADFVALLMKYDVSQKDARRLAVRKFGLKPKAVAEAHRRLLKFKRDELENEAEAHRRRLRDAGVHK